MDELTATATTISKGACALHLVLEAENWIHRRVETVTFQAHGETRRRISWDFTVPTGYAIDASVGQIAVPLTLLTKTPLKRLDLVDAQGTSLPLWGTEDNGDLALQMLLACVEAAQGRRVNSLQSNIAKEIVFLPSIRSGESGKLVKKLRDSIQENASSHASDVVGSLASDLCEQFLFVVEIPASKVGSRTLIKASYDEAVDSPQRPKAWSGEMSTTIKTPSMASAKSWHLEVLAPPGLAVSDLQFESWDLQTEDLVDEGWSYGDRHTGHVYGNGGNSGIQTECRLSTLPAPEGLLSQTFVGAWVALVLIFGEVSLKIVNPQWLADPGRSGGIATVVLAFPALFFALQARPLEHPYVAEGLFHIRIANLVTAVALFLSAGHLISPYAAWSAIPILLLIAAIALWTSWLRVLVSRSL